jgi:hypothetical protein
VLQLRCIVVNGPWKDFVELAGFKVAVLRFKLSAAEARGVTKQAA